VSPYSVWPYLALLAVILLIIRRDRPFRAIDGATLDSGRRFAAIDGLRGLLAFGVFGHHAVLIPRYLEGEAWVTPPSVFYAMIGEVGVGLFFVVTGFLFWGKLLHERGRPHWRQLYIGRLFRIGPVYFAVVAVMLLVVMVRTDFQLREPVADVVLDTGRWLALGALGQPDVNAYPDTGRLLAGVTWTLAFEWLFYCSLPLLAPFARGGRHLWFALAGLFACCVLHAILARPHPIYIGLFFCGMISASLVHLRWRLRAGGWLAPVLMLGCLALLFTNFSTIVGIPQLILMGAFFAALCTGGASPVLEARPVRRLGDISYSVYLVHGLVLTGIFSIGAVRSNAMASLGSYWLTIALCGLLVIGVSVLSYVLIERPGIRLGKKVAGWLAPARAAAKSAVATS
jgi:peptidoglycan/LPS O-acetylase OafA/YrhL